MTSWATVIGPGRGDRGFRQPIVDSDFAWLVKACYHEVSGNLRDEFEWGAVLWTLTNRWASRYGRAGETLGGYAQRFCQPINPDQIGKLLADPGSDYRQIDKSIFEADKILGSPGSDYYDYDADELPSDRNLPACQGGGAGSAACAEARAQARWARIRANRARPISCYTEGGSNCGSVRPAPELAAYVLRWMQGGVWDPRYVGLMDWAARGYRYDPAEDIPVDLPTRDAFYRETWQRGWNASTVRMVDGSAGIAASPSRAGFGFAFGVLLAGVGVGLLVRHRRRSVPARVWGRPVRRRRR